jgi:Family of unknown function (DUF5682)
VAKSDVHYLGIRHHGPGSARAVALALDALDPSVVLIEGPADASEHLGLLTRPEIELPIALLSYAPKRPELASFFPLASFSPELQAARWALSHGREVRFIDLPAAIRFGLEAEALDRAKESQASEVGSEKLPGAQLLLPEPPPDPFRLDPIGALATSAGYRDGESFWNDLFEAHPEPGPIFEAVETLITELRNRDEEDPAPSERRTSDARREAYMRIEIDKTRKSSEGAVAVVCGAWHVPALRRAIPLKDDRAVLTGLPKIAASATWVPWTYPRLARRSGYGAGVLSPLWYEHLSIHGNSLEGQSRWLAKVAGTLRSKGFLISTAALIEATRLARVLGSLRERPAPNFEELEDAMVATYAFGDPNLFRSHEDALLIGTQVGAAPEGQALTPLLDDLGRRQREAKLKPSASQEELSLDLRSESGLLRSTLLHQLLVLEVPWGQVMDAGGSRGTFRERWLLHWNPELGVRLVEHVVHGGTIRDAAASFLLQRLSTFTRLAQVIAAIESSLVAQLPSVAAQGTRRLDELAAHTSDVFDVLSALPALAKLVRYGTAREMDIREHGRLFSRLLAQGSASLPYAARNLAPDQVELLGAHISEARSAVALMELPEDEVAFFRAALRQVVEDPQGSPGLVGLSARLLHTDGVLLESELEALLSQRLSPGVPVADAAAFFEGFFSTLGARLTFDVDLRRVIDAWILALGPEDFIENLPLLRRTFADLDKPARKSLYEAAVHGGKKRGPRMVDAAGLAAWDEHRAALSALWGM